MICEEVRRAVTIARKMVTEPFPRKEAVVIVNPAAHHAPRRKRVVEAQEWLRERGWKCEWLETTRAAESIRMAQAAARREVPLLFVWGGDGTLNEAANGLAKSETALSVIPSGTTNLWAREVGLLKRPLEAIGLTLEGVRRRVDLGLAGSRYFLLMAGFGIDAAVVQRVSRGVKGRLGAAAYALAAVRQVMSYRGSRLTLSMDGEERVADVLMVVAGNTRNYAGLTKITPEAVIDDGRLDVCVYQGRGRWDIVWLAILTLLRQHGRSKNVLRRRVKLLKITNGMPLPAQLDGEAIGDSPPEVTVVRDALWVVTPRSLTSPLFSQPPEPQ